MENKDIDYNKEPVYFCKDCLSLKVMELGGEEYCEKCGSSDIGKTDIYTWQKLYQEKYKKKFIKEKINGEGLKKSWL